MTDSTLAQERLSPNAPPDWHDSGKTISRILRYDVGTAPNKTLSFQYEKVSNDPYDLNFLIDDFCYVELYLASDSGQNWFWSTQLDAVTTKRDYCMLYGQLEYKISPSEQYATRPVGDATRYKCVRFKARPNVYGMNGPVEVTHHSDRNHGFSLNIDMEQPGGRILPITLDPDIKNPPPPHAIYLDGYLYAE